MNNTENNTNDKQNHMEKIDFNNIDPLQILNYSINYKCSKASLGQLILAIDHMGRQINGTHPYENTKKNAVNEFQKSLYPRISELSNFIVNEYKNTFINNKLDDDNLLRREVFGANLNGNRNNGQLNRYVSCRFVPKFLTYEYAQLGSLLKLIFYRLDFIINRNPNLVNRYVENRDQYEEFIILKERAVQYKTYLDNTIMPLWATYIKEARDKNNNMNHQTPNPVRLNNDKVIENTNDNYRNNYRNNYHNNRYKRNYYRHRD